MDLDFSGLYSIAGTKSNTAPSKKPLGGDSSPSSSEGILKCAKEQKTQRRGKEARRRAMLDEYARKNATELEVKRLMGLANDLQVLITEGVARAEDPCSMMVDVASIVEKMTKWDDSSLKDKVATLYGVGLGEPEPLEWKIEEEEKALRKLRRGRAREEFSSEQELLDSAIKDRQDRLNFLNKLKKDGNIQEDDETPSE